MAINLKVSDHVGNGQKAIFRRYAAGALWYETDRTGFLFQVPVDEIEGTSVSAREPAILFMRWIRRQMDSNEQALKEQQGA